MEQTTTIVLVGFFILLMGMAIALWKVSKRVNCMDAHFFENILANAHSHRHINNRVTAEVETITETIAAVVQDFNKNFNDVEDDVDILAAKADDSESFQVATLPRS
jgi:hypothetical protein